MSLPVRSWNGPIPSRVARLPKDSRGYPVPWFVAWDGDKPLFPVMDTAKFRQAIRHRRCWICGDTLGKFFAFVIGPMCAVNKVNSEPPSHLDCARFAARNCPFLVNPNQKRIVTQDGTKIVSRDKRLDVSEARDAAGLPIDRNPGCCAVWVTTSYRPFAAGGGNAGTLISLGAFTKLEFYSHGRPATRAEVEDSVRSGLPFLLETAIKHDGPSGIKALERQVETFWKSLDELPWPVAEDVDLKRLYGEAS